MVEISWSHGRARLSPTAAMLTSADFRVADRWFSPFASAPWDPSDPALAELPGHLRVLGGEFVCLPFGSAAGPRAAAPGWAAFEDLPADRLPHGPAADEDWRLEHVGDGSATFSLRYPAAAPVERVERTVRGVPGRPALEFSLSVVARRPVRLPIGVHPIFRLPDEPARLALSAEFDAGFGYPGDLPGSVVPVGATFHDLARSGTADLSRLPLSVPVEQVVLLAGGTGAVRLSYLDDAVAVDLEWDRSVLPSLMLWISDRALESSPWNGTYRGLGVEPIAAAFDLPGDVSSGPNPLSDRGIPTAIDLHPDRPTVLRYSISAHALEYV